MKNLYLFLVSLLILNACNNSTKGDGNIVSENRGIFKNYEKIKVDGPFNVKISSTNFPDSQKLLVITDKNIQEFVKVYIKNNILYIKAMGNTDIEPTKAIIKLIGNSELDIENSGAGIVSLNAKLNKLKIQNDGSGDCIIQGALPPFIEIYNSGSGKIKVLSDLDEIQMYNSGSGSISTEDINVNDITVNNSGSGECTVNALKKLYVIISGSGNVYYKGKPEIIKDLTGSGEVEKL